MLLINTKYGLRTILKQLKSVFFLHLGASVGMYVPISVACFKHFSVICETPTV